MPMTAVMMPAVLLQAHVMSIHITPDEVDYVHGILGQTLRLAEPSMLGGGVVAQVTDAPRGAAPVRPLLGCSSP